MSIDLTNPIFSNEEAARKHFEVFRVCPHCGVVDNSVELKGDSTRDGLYKCRACELQFSAMIGTVMESSHVPMTKWALAFHLMASSKKGVSAHQLMRTLGLGSYRTAWFMAHKDPEPLGGKGKTVEVDETFIGKPDEIFVSGKGWQSKRGTATKRKVLTMVERGGRAVSVKVEDLTVDTLKTVIGKTVVLDSDLNTDEARHYKAIGKNFASHGAVNHSEEEYVRREGEKLVTTNTVEGFFGIFKRGMVGVYQHCAEHHLQAYLNEFDFRYSNRIRDGDRRYRTCAPRHSWRRASG
jgi:transposase-like protein